MKKQILLNCLAILMSLSVSYGQIDEGSRSMSQGIQNALIIEIPDVEEKTVIKLWKKYIKEYDGKKIKRNRKADEYFTDNAEIPALGGTNSVDVYARIAESGDDVSVTAWFDLGGSFLSSNEHPQEYVEAEKMMMRFALNVAQKLTQDELDDQLKALKKLESKLKKLKNANDNYHRDIENAKARIAKAEGNIIENEQEQVTAAEKIEAQKEIVKAVQERLNDL
ncbi:MAG: hypothetical protein AB8G15_13850 [Saprospiraceae bacterium]